MGDSANFIRKRGLTICKKTKYVKILQADQEDSTGEVTNILLDPILIQIIDLGKDDLLILENYDVACYKKIIVKPIIKYNYSSCRY